MKTGRMDIQKTGRWDRWFNKKCSFVEKLS